MEPGDWVEAAEASQRGDGVSWEAGSGDRESGQVGIAFGGRADHAGWCMTCENQERKRSQQ